MPSTPKIVRFGLFELDLTEGVLIKNGRRIKLQEQPFRLLLILLEQPGRIVTRETLRQTLWTADTFVDFDRGLNAAVAKLRQALGDSAANPTFIQTQSRHGYRFIAPVEDTRERPIEPQVETAVKETYAQPTGSAKKIWWTVAASSVAAIVVLIAGYLWLRPARTLTNKGTIVISDFTNTTGDPMFDGALRQGLRVQLEQSPSLSILSEERIQRTLGLMGRAADVKVTAQIAREICERVGGSAVIEGSIAALGHEYVLGLSAKSCPNGEILYEEQTGASRKEEVLSALTSIADKLRNRAGDSLAANQKYDVPLEDATTTSLEALKAYSLARQSAFATGYTSAIPHFKRAVELDPHFAMAYAFLGRIYADSGESILSREASEKAFQFREHASEREKFWISFSYDMQVTGNLEKARQTAETWKQAYPRIPDPSSLLSGFATQGAGQYDRSIDEAERAIKLDPDNVPVYENLAFTYFYLNRFTDAQSVLQRAKARKLEISDYIILRYYLAFFMGDEAGMQREAALAQGNAGAEDWMAHNQALVLAHSGHLQQARALSDRASALAQQLGNLERAALYQTGAALYEAFAGNITPAQALARNSLTLAPCRDVRYSAAIVFALTKDTADAERQVQELQREFPEDTVVRFEYLPTLRALLTIARGEPAKAIELLNVCGPYDMAVPGTAFFGLFGGMYPAYFRGQAYLAAHQAKLAATEFQKVLDHRGIVFADPIDALARLQLGRAFVSMGDRPKAKSAYRDFLHLWQNADANIPLLTQAQAEYARLN